METSEKIKRLARFVDLKVNVLNDEFTQENFKYLYTKLTSIQKEVKYLENKINVIIKENGK